MGRATDTANRPRLKQFQITACRDGERTASPSPRCGRRRTGRTNGHTLTDAHLDLAGLAEADALLAELDVDWSDGEFSNQVKERFTAERDGVHSLETPGGWSFTMVPAGLAVVPNLMQEQVAVHARDRSRYGNWSDAGTGAGKTVSAMLGVVFPV